MGVMPQPSYEYLAGLLDHALLTPTSTDAELRKGCQALRGFPLATVCIKPHAVKLALAELAGTSIDVCTVIGFPHGTPLPVVKAYEAEQAFLDGAGEVDMVVNTGKVLSEDWSYVREDIASVTAVTRLHKGIIKVIFETDFLPDARHKIRLCEICSELKVDFVKTSTGFGYVKGKEGGYDYCGATDHDLKLMRKHCSSDVGVKASGGVRNLDRALEVVALGVTRIGTGSAPAILREYHQRFGT
jgi:deoxyribose-phosphate aldolase